MKTIKNYIAIFMIVALMFTQSAPSVVWAEEAPAAPVNTNAAPATPENTNTAPTAPTAPTTPGQNEPTASPSPEQNTNQEQVNATPTATPTLTPEEQQRQAAKDAAAAAYWANYNQPKTGPTSNGNTNSPTVIATGDANNNSTTTTTGNTNAVAQGQASGAVTDGSTGAVINSGNGAGSNNSGNSSSVIDNNANQNNSAIVTNNVTQSASTGDSQSSFNTGGDTIIKTGDANTSATAITAVNTNVDGVMVSEFNIADDHKGDIVLDAAALAANCVSGCGQTGTVQNTGNGANSTNNATANNTVNNNTTQTNDATVGNNMNLSANSGTNDASFNTGGDNIIYTGDANVAANSLTFANNNIQGNVTFTTVNVYGTLDGDIIIPGFSGGALGSDATIVNTGNGANSTNNAVANSTTNNTANQTNDATITNELVIDAETGNNSAAYGTDGNGTIKTGDTNVDANVVNIANTNVNGGDMWLVFINNAGTWIGQLVGAPLGAMMAGSEGTQFTEGSDGQLTVSNNGNGAGSTNNAESNSTVNNNVDQNNTANIHNTMNLAANTGGNTANFNTGGNNTIVTGDANVMANFFNFVNNNIIGNGTLHIAVINIFGEMAGNIWTPDNPKPANAPDAGSISDARGGVNTTANTAVTPTITGTVAEEQTIIEQEEEESEVATAHSNTTRKYRSRSISYTNNNGTYTGAGSQTQIAGASTVNENSGIAKQLFGAENKKKIQLNLAYLVFLLPLVAAALITKKFVFSKLLAKKN